LKRSIFVPCRDAHAPNFLGHWNGKLVCGDFPSYKTGFEQGITEIGSMAHARRKFFDLRAANKGQLPTQRARSANCCRIGGGLPNSRYVSWADA